MREKGEGKREAWEGRGRGRERGREKGKGYIIRAFRGLGFRLLNYHILDMRKRERMRES